MSNPAPASPSKSKETSAKNTRIPLLGSRRLFELVGLLTSVAGLLILLSLASYLPEDPSLNTAVATGTLPHNWIGPAGALVADGLFQFLGWVAYLLPLALLVMGVRPWNGILDRLMWPHAYEVVCQSPCPVVTVRGNSADRRISI